MQKDPTDADRRREKEKQREEKELQRQMGKDASLLSSCPTTLSLDFDKTRNAEPPKRGFKSAFGREDEYPNLKKDVEVTEHPAEEVKLEDTSRLGTPADTSGLYDPAFPTSGWTI